MTRRSAPTFAALLLAGSAVIVAQQFDVVSVKPTQPGSPGGPGPFVQTEPGFLRARGSLQFFIEYAYGQNPQYLEGGPDWIRSDRFDIEGRQSSGAQSLATLPIMLRTALTDRFKLAVRRETRERPVLLLTVAKGGPKLTLSEANEEPQLRGRPGELVASKMSMKGLASQLSRLVGRQVEDRTGLTGLYTFTLHATNEGFQKPDPLGRAPVDPDAPDISTALDEQLGLKLESGRGPVTFLIIDRAERPTAD